MEGTYRAELENDGSCLLLTIDAAERLRLRVAIPWVQITEAVSQEIRARFTHGNIAIHFVGCEHLQPFDRIIGVPGEVRRQNHVRQATQRRIGRQRLALEDIERGTADPSSTQSVRQGRGVDECSTRSIDHDR